MLNAETRRLTLNVVYGALILIGIIELGVGIAVRVYTANVPSVGAFYAGIATMILGLIGFILPYPGSGIAVLVTSPVAWIVVLVGLIIDNYWNIHLWRINLCAKVDNLGESNQQFIYYGDISEATEAQLGISCALPIVDPANSKIDCFCIANLGDSCWTFEAGKNPHFNGDSCEPMIDHKTGFPALVRASSSLCATLLVMCSLVGFLILLAFCGAATEGAFRRGGPALEPSLTPPPTTGNPLYPANSPPTTVATAVVGSIPVNIPDEAKVGDTVAFTTPSGQARQVIVQSIYQPGTVVFVDNV